MDSIYENPDITLSSVSSDEKCSQHRGNSTEEREGVRERAQARAREVTFSKWTKVSLIVLGFSLVFALGGLCTLGVIYNHKLADFESLNEQNIMISKTLAAQEINSTAMKKEFNDLTSRYDTLRERLSFYEAQSCNISVNGWLVCHGKLYFFSSDKLNWTSSRDVCVSKGADLVTITRKSEQDFLASKINEATWIGLNDLDTEGHWVWVNNQTLTDIGLQFWSSDPQQPNGGRSANCVALGTQSRSLDSWFDAPCAYTKKFICEKNF